MGTYVAPTGFSFISSSEGGSVARAKAPKVSMIKLTHSNCHGYRRMSAGMPNRTRLINKHENAGHELLRVLASE